MGRTLFPHFRRYEDSSDCTCPHGASFLAGLISKRSRVVLVCAAVMGLDRIFKVFGLGPRCHFARCVRDDRND